MVSSHGDSRVDLRLDKIISSQKRVGFPLIEPMPEETVQRGPVLCSRSPCAS